MIYQNYNYEVFYYEERYFYLSDSKTPHVFKQGHPRDGLAFFDEKRLFTTASLPQARAWTEGREPLQEILIYARV